MALLWCDGFDHYGLDETNMTDGAWAEVDPGVGTGWILSTVNPRTGTHSLRRGGGSGVRLARRVLGGAKTTVGQGAVFYPSFLPDVNNTHVLYDFRDAGNSIQVTVLVQSTGVISVKSGNMLGTELGATATPAVVAEAYQHIETIVTIDSTVGEVEVRVNGVTVLALTGVNTNPIGTGECSQVALVGYRNTGVGGSPNWILDVDDYYCYDDSGSFNNTFIGDRRVLTLFPNADTAQEDWTPSTGVDSFAMVDEADPNDDTDYIFTSSSGSPGTITEFDLDNLPAGVSSVSAVQLVHRSRKTDAGVANVQLSAVSAASETAGTDRPVTEAYTYYHDVIEADPDTAAPFTPSAVDALKLKIERTS